MKPLVFLTRVMPAPVMLVLRRRFHLTWNRRDRPLSKREISLGLRQADGLVSMLNDTIDSSMIKAAPRLKIIANYAVGFNNIALGAASTRNIAVTNTPGVLTEATADLCWALMLAVARRIPESEQLVRSGGWTGWAPTQMVGCDVYGKVLGLIGMGRIGQAVARRSRGFSMKVFYYSRHRLPASQERSLGVRYRPLARLLSISDVVSLHLPLNEASHHLIDRKALRLMKPTAFLINTARGPVVDEAVLIEALQRRKLAGAGFDVYEGEPRVPARLRRLKNVVLLPHIGSGSTDTRLRMGEMVVENLSACFSGKRPPHRVN